MAFHLVTNGQEQLTQNNLDGETVDVGLYNDSTDNPGVGATLADITTEPGPVNREQSTLTLSVSGNFVELNGSQITFQVTSASANVDAYFLVNDDGNGDELILTGALEDTRDLSEIDELEVDQLGSQFTTPA